MLNIKREMVLETIIHKKEIGWLKKSFLNEIFQTQFKFIRLQEKLIIRKEISRTKNH